jgi:hypothetical protein
MAKTIKETCQNCDAKYKIVFDAEEVGEVPTFCPFCGESTEDWGEEEDLDLNQDEDDWE